MYPAHIKSDGTVQTCRDHCKNVARIAEAQLRASGLGNTAYLAGLLHDCGKLHKSFSDYLQKAASGETVKKGSVIHSFAAVTCFLTYYHSNLKFAWSLPTRGAWIEIVSTLCRIEEFFLPL